MDSLLRILLDPFTVIYFPGIFEQEKQHNFFNINSLTNILLESCGPNELSYVDLVAKQ